MMKRMTIAAAVLALATPLTAQTRQPGALFLSQWDADADGRVTWAEAAERRASLFEMFDQDSDGRLSPAEIAGIDDYRQGMAEAGFGPMTGGGRQQAGARGGQGRVLLRLDADANGSLSAAEFAAGAAPWFARMDRNGDGSITERDFGRW